ncbi:hypothetical protein [uncultured Paraglaciecola sp.]|uniref:hypothetical protein n=1 Tax=uncultured Paraglaciecola sp. TaxID=1765024 RepID=UPI0026233EC6|nr:hypothetical protein [uncultured Paraglaciecola sp.]
MANLDPKFLIAPNLQENFIDKDTGCPLVGGKVKFFQDESRQTPKNVYALTGAPPNYTYTDIGSVVTLNAAGATSYDFGSGSTDVKIYCNPFDSDGEIQLYYVEVESSSGVKQLTREAWPDTKSSSGGSGGNGDSAFTNYIPNGQFLHHNDLQDNGLIVDESTNIALGGWTFERSPSSSAVDNVTFPRFSSYSDNPEAHPRYAVRVINTGGGSGDLKKDLTVKFDDVSKFGSDEQLFTFKFAGKSTSGSFDVDLVLIKNYGTGGSSTTETSIGTFTMTGSYQSFVASFVFGDNSTKTIGTLDDDFVQLAIRLPIGIVFEGEFTDYSLLEGEFADVFFPDTTSRQSISQFLGGAFPVPDFTGRDLYLPPRLTATGWEFDHTQVGMVYAKSTLSLEVGELWADGSSYLTNDYSSDGIPFIRLQEKYFDSATSTPIYGTGDDYATSYFPGAAAASDTLFLTANAEGSASVITDGSTATGFTFTISHSGVGSSSFGANNWVTTPGNSWMQNEANGLTTAPSSGTSTVIVGSNYEIDGTAETPQEFDVIFPLASTLGNGAGAAKYWRYYSVGQAYYVWYITATESDPSVGGAIGIPVTINLTDDSVAVAEKTVAAISNFQSSTITTVAASGMTAGAYFTFGAPSEDFYVWYTIDGAGTDPLISNHTEIQVDILSTDDADSVALKTQTSINSRKFAVPDYREQFLRGANMGRDEIGLDGSIPYRFNRKNFKFGADSLGSEELSLIRMHNHEAVTTPNVLIEGDTAPGGVSFNKDVINVSVTVLDSGFQESRPANAYINYVIKY